MDTNKQVSDTERVTRSSRRPRCRGAAAGRGRAAVPALTVLAAAGLLGGCAATSAGSQPASGTVSKTATAPAASAGTGPAGTVSGAGGSSPAGPGAAAASCTSAPAGSSGSAAAPALQAVQFTDANHGWVAGAGRILATSDGGRSWTGQYSGGAELYQVDFTDAAHGWAVGQGALLHTADGGASWTALSEPELGGHCLAVASVHFVSPADGYAVAAPPAAGTGSAGSTSGDPGTPASGGQLLRTTDGGATWTAVPGAPSGVQSACFGTAQDGYAGAAGRIWRTTDAGKSWALAFTEPSASAASQSAGDVPELECAGQDAAWVLFLGDGTAMAHAPYLAYATGQGGSWHGVMEETMLESALRPGLHLPEGPGSEPGPFSVISPDSAVFVGYTPPANGYGAAPVDLVTGGGATVTGDGDVAAVNEPLAAAFTSQDKGWVVGENLKTNTFAVEATSDAGRSWTTQYTVR